MKSHRNYHLLEDADFGYPRFTTMRRQLSDYRELAKDFYRKMCREFDIISPPPLNVIYLLNNSEKILNRNSSAGICYYFHYTDTPNTPLEWCVAISWTHAKLFHEKTLHETVPHEICHAIHGMVDFESYSQHDHGQDFLDIYAVGKKFYSFVKPSVSFLVESEKYSALHTIMSEDLTTFRR